MAQVFILLIAIVALGMWFTIEISLAVERVWNHALPHAVSRPIR